MTLETMKASVKKREGLSIFLKKNHENIQRKKIVFLIQMIDIQQDQKGECIMDYGAIKERERTEKLDGNSKWKLWLEFHN